MTLTVICGEGHINTYNLITIPKYKPQTNTEGELHLKKFTWEEWKCKTPACKHKEYVNHVLDKKWIETHGEESGTNPLLAALFILSILLNIKTKIGI